MMRVVLTTLMCKLAVDKVQSGRYVVRTGPVWITRHSSDCNKKADPTAYVGRSYVNDHQTASISPKSLTNKRKVSTP